MRYKRRIRRMEKAIEDIQKNSGVGVRVVLKKLHEDEEQCLDRQGHERNFGGLTVFINKFIPADEIEEESIPNEISTETKKIENFTLNEFQEYSTKLHRI